MQNFDLRIIHYTIENISWKSLFSFWNGSFFGNPRYRLFWYLLFWPVNLPCQLYWKKLKNTLAEIANNFKSFSNFGSSVRSIFRGPKMIINWLMICKLKFICTSRFRAVSGRAKILLVLRHVCIRLINHRWLIKAIKH